MILPLVVFSGLFPLFGLFSPFRENILQYVPIIVTTRQLLASTMSSPTMSVTTLTEEPA